MEALAIAQHQIAVKDWAGARRTLVALLREEPDNVEAWLLLAPLLPDPARQTECYRRVLHLKPHHIQARALFNAAHRRQPAAQPPAMASPPPQSPTPIPAGIPNPFAEGENEDEEVAFEYEPEPSSEILEELAAGEPGTVAPQALQDLTLQAWVVKELTNHVGQNEIIRQLCARTGMDWPQAEKLVLRIAQQERHTIAKKQAPLLILLSLGALVGGAAILIATYRPEGLLIMLGGLIGLLRVWYTLKKAPTQKSKIGEG